MKRRLTILALLLFTALQLITAQCKLENKYFQNGEKLTYDMYFKLGFTSTKAGKLSLSASEGKYKGKGDHLITFQTNTSGMVNGIYPVHDTLYAYMSKDVVPIAYLKNALESGEYTKEELYYTYLKDGKVQINTKRYRNGEFKFDEELTSDVCIYDMVSVVYYARTLDFANMKKGDQTKINFISGMKMSTLSIEYKGSKNMKANNGKKYNCLELSLNYTSGGASDKSKEMMKVYISDDKNRLPIQIETNLKKIGAIKGVLKGFEGLRHTE